MENKTAIISDIHGNTWALERVLADIMARKIETIINLGDSLNGPLDPIGTYNLLTENNILSISGNGDRLILESLYSKVNNTTAEYVLSQMNNDIIDWLHSLPFDFVYDDIYCCHASPENDMEYLLERLKPDHIEIKEFSEIGVLLKEIKQKVVVCGHSHIPRIVKTSKKLICNAGSVGLQAYDDDLPTPHKMENFSPHARYSIITKHDKSFMIEQIAIPYNFEKAAQKAEVNNRKDWAQWLRTGKVQ